MADIVLKTMFKDGVIHEQIIKTAIKEQKLDDVYFYVLGLGEYKSKHYTTKLTSRRINRFREEVSKMNLELADILPELKRNKFDLSQLPFKEIDYNTSICEKYIELKNKVTKEYEIYMKSLTYSANLIDSISSHARDIFILTRIYEFITIYLFEIICKQKVGELSLKGININGIVGFLTTNDFKTLLSLDNTLKELKSIVVGLNVSNEELLMATAALCSYLERNNK